MSVPSIWLALTGSAKTLAFMRDVARMPSAQCATIKPSANASQATEATRIRYAASTNASQTPSAQTPKHAGTKSVLTLVNALSSPNAHPGTTGASVPALLGTLATPMEFGAHQVSYLYACY